MDGNRKLMFMKSAVLLFILFFFSCLSDKNDKNDKKLAPYPYKSELNSIRNKVGLRVIDSTFSITRKKSLSTFTTIGDFYRDVSLYPNNFKKNERSKTPHFYKKSIDLDSKSGKPISEADIFRSGLSKFSLKQEGTIYESISTKYYYEDFIRLNPINGDTLKFYKGDWEYSHNVIDTFKLTSSNRPEQLKKIHWELKTIKLSKKEVDSIFKSWSLKKLNY